MTYCAAGGYQSEMKRPALASAFFLALGIFLAQCFYLSSFHLFLLALVLLLVALIFHLKNKSIVSTLALFGIIASVGAIRFNQATYDFPINHIRHFAHLNQRFQYTGEIVDQPDLKKNLTRLSVAVKTISNGATTLSTQGKILVQIKELTLKFAYGDEIKFSGRLWAPSAARNPGTLNYKEYLLRKGIFAVVYLTRSQEIISLQSDSKPFLLRNIIHKSRTWILQQSQRHLSSSSNALFTGFLLGETRQIPREIYQLFRDTGTLHLLAVSGANVGLVAGFVFILFRLLLLSRRIAICLALILIWFYAGLSEFQPSVVRAAIMWSVGIAAFWFYRKPDLLNVVGFAGLFMLFFKPLWLFEVGFQLSFAATIGLVWLVAKLDEQFYRFSSSVKPLARFFILPVGVSLIAQLSTLAITIFYFHRFSYISPLANLVLVPLASLALLISIPVLVLVWLNGSLAPVLFPPVDHLMHITLRVADFFSSGLSVKTSTGPCDFWFLLILVVVSWGLMGLVISKRLRLTITLLIISGLNLFIWRSQLNKDSEFTICFLDAAPARFCVVSYQPPGQTTGRSIVLGQGNVDQVHYTLLPYLTATGINRISTLFFNEDPVLFQSVIQELASEARIDTLPTLVQKTRDSFRPSSSPPGDFQIWSIYDSLGQKLLAYRIDRSGTSILYCGTTISIEQLKTCWPTNHDIRIVALPANIISPQLKEFLVAAKPVAVVVEGRPVRESGVADWSVKPISNELPGFYSLIKTGALTLQHADQKITATGFLSGRLFVLRK